MKIFRIQFCLILALVVSLASVSNVHAQFEKSAKWVPEAANVLVMIQAEKILDSAIGKREKWKGDRSKAFRSGAAFFPPTTRRILMASQIDFEFMESVFHVGVFEKKGSDIDILEVSKRIKGNIETIDGQQALVLPNNSYLVQIAADTLLSMTPANRQLVTRLLRKKMAGAMSISPYLTQAVKYADQNAQVIVAFDLGGVLTEAEIAKRLTENNTIGAALIDQAAKTLNSIQGVTLGVNVRDKISGAINVDFSQDPTNLTPSAKKILIAALKKNGLMIDDIESWNTTIKDNQIRIAGDLSTEGLRQIGSLIHQPLIDDLSGASDSASIGAGEPQVDTLTRTKQYFGDVQHVFEMLRRKDVEQLDTYMKWFNRYSRDIDGISVIGVDPAMVAYGTYVADSFRDISGILSGANLEKNRGVAAQGFSGPGSRTWNYGYGYGTISSRQYTRNSRRTASALGTEKGKDAAMVVVREVESETAKIRKAMSDKYQTDF